jgi:hypothetical protein
MPIRTGTKSVKSSKWGEIQGLNVQNITTVYQGVSYKEEKHKCSCKFGRCGYQLVAPFVRYPQFGSLLLGFTGAMSMMVVPAVRNMAVCPSWLIGILGILVFLMQWEKVDSHRE